MSGGIESVLSETRVFPPSPEFVKNANVPFTTYTQVTAIPFPPSLELFQHHNSVFVFLSMR